MNYDLNCLFRFYIVLSISFPSVIYLLIHSALKSHVISKMRHGGRIKTLNDYLWVKFDGNSTSMSQHQEITCPPISGDYFMTLKLMIKTPPFNLRWISLQRMTFAAHALLLT